MRTNRVNFLLAIKQKEISMFRNSKQQQRSKRLHRNAHGYVYLLRELDHNGQPTGLYKIGHSNRGGETRISEYQAGNARKLELVLEVETENRHQLEADLHRQFQPNNVGNGGTEWFVFQDVNIPMDALIQNSGVKTNTNRNSRNAPPIPAFRPSVKRYVKMPRYTKRRPLIGIGANNHKKITAYDLIVISKIGLLLGIALVLCTWLISIVR